MATGKTTTLTIRIGPELKAALRTAAEHEHRSIANMIEVLIRDHCTRMGIGISKKDVTPSEQARNRTRGKTSRLRSRT